MKQYTQQTNQFNQQMGVYNDYQAKGTATSADIGDIVQNLPGFRFQQQQGISGIQNAASASGMLNSGSLLQGLNKFGQDLSSTYFGNYLNQLGSLASMGQQSNASAQAGALATGQQVAGQYSNLGNAQANAALAAGQAMASSYLSPAKNQTVNMFPYTTSSTTDSQGSALGGISQGLGLLSSIGGMFSSKELKTSYGTVNTDDILKNVDAMSLERWQYKGIDNTHIGPYAEEFKELFKVGDGQTINMIDIFGVLIGSIKELNAKITALQNEALQVSLRSK